MRRALTWLLVAAVSASLVGSVEARSADRKTAVQKAYAALSPAQRVGQLFMAGISSTRPSHAAVVALRAHAVGNVILDGNSSLGIVETSTLVGRLNSGLAIDGLRPFVATDQEGGEVQRLRGQGFSAMPTALDQGRLPPRVLQSRATKLGRADGDRGGDAEPRTSRGHRARSASAC